MLTDISEKSSSSRWSLETLFPSPPAIWKQQGMTIEELWGVCWPVERVLMGHLFHICFFFTTSVNLHSGNKLLWYLLCVMVPPPWLWFKSPYRTEKPLQLQLENQALGELCKEFSFSASGIEGDMHYVLHEIFLVLLKNCCSFWPNGGKWKQVEWEGPYEYTELDIKYCYSFIIPSDIITLLLIWK